jgi:hypothetical protein
MRKRLYLGFLLAVFAGFTLGCGTDPPTTQPDADAAAKQRPRIPPMRGPGNKAPGAPGG